MLRPAREGGPRSHYCSWRSRHRSRRNPIRPAPAFKRDALVAAPTANWPTNGGNWYNQRYSPLTAIDRDNVGTLKGVWRTRLGGSGVGTKYSGEAQPIVYDGVIYVVTGADDVFAIGVESGEILWSYAANLDDTNDVVCCGWTSRGVGFGDGKVFVGQLDGKLVALDQKTGGVAWSVQAERWQDGLTITSAPLYYDGLVITGFAGAEYGIRGRVKAFDARNGKLEWTFYTIPGPGELGHDTWPQDNDLWMHGGASVWQTPAVDPELGLIFFSTGNPGPDYNGGVRAGDNLFSASIVALEAKTGEYRWHFQQVHHDIWDYDGPSPVVLFDIELNGTPRKGIAQPSKTGWVYILDRTNGTPLIGIDERPVPQEPRQATAATQPYPRGDAFVPQSIAVAPEGLRARERRQDLHAVLDRPRSADEAVVRRRRELAAELVRSADGLPLCVRAGSRRRVQGRSAVASNGRRPASATSPASSAHPACRASACSRHSTCARTRSSGNSSGPTLAIAARRRRPAGSRSSAATTAGSRRSTRAPVAKLWEFQTGAGMNAPVSVFEHGGKQYVVAYSAGNLFAGSPKGDSVWLFGLDGTLPPAPPPGAAMLFTREAEGTADPPPAKSSTRRRACSVTASKAKAVTAAARC